MYTDEKLVLELQRFYNEFNRVPSAIEMDAAEGYPSVYVYKKHFKTWNKALIAAGFEINNKHQVGKLDGTETCSYCGKRANEISNFKGWLYDENENRFCRQHGPCGQGGLPDYVLGNLDINSSTGLGRAGEILVVKTLGIGNEHDCNRISCGYSFDIYYKEYGKIDVKTSLLSDNYNNWNFHFNAKKEVDTYICIGLSSDRSIVEHVWIISNKNEIRNCLGLQIYNTYRSLSTHKKWEVDSKPYNDMWKTMKLKTCNSMTDKSKPRVKLTWEEAVKKAAEIRKEIELRKLYDGD